MFFLVPIGFGYSVKLKLICTSPCFLCSASTLACPYLVSLLLHRFDYNVVRFHRRYPLKKQAHSILPSTILGKGEGTLLNYWYFYFFAYMRWTIKFSSLAQSCCLWISFQPMHFGIVIAHSFSFFLSFLFCAVCWLFRVPLRNHVMVRYHSFYKHFAIKKLDW